MILINGNEMPDAEGLSIGAYLDSNGYDRQRIAIERNQAIIRKCDYDTTILCDQDVIEIVSFVGGG